MSTSARTPRSRATLACAALVLLPACTPAPSGTPASSATTPSTAVPSTPAASPAASPTPTATPSTSPTSASADVVQLRVTIRDGQVSPNGEKIRVRRGQTVALEVTSDAEDEVHAHIADDDFSLAVQPGKPARGEFEATESGTFEIELHHLDKIVALLIVR